jgi:molybdopterin-binding protein
MHSWVARRRVLGVRVDTLRRFYRAGRSDGPRSASGPGAFAFERLAERPRRQQPGHALFAGVVRSVEVSGPTALVEIEAGPFLFRAAVDRREVEALSLAAGSPARATVEGTSVRVDRGA